MSIYAEAQGVPLDYVKDREYVEHAAAMGDAASMCNLGIINSHGLGVAPDEKMARTWFVKACGAGFRHGCLEVMRLEQRKLQKAGK